MERYSQPEATSQEVSQRNKCPNLTLFPSNLLVLCFGWIQRDREGTRYFCHTSYMAQVLRKQTKVGKDRVCIWEDKWKISSTVFGNLI